MNSNMQSPIFGKKNCHVAAELISITGTPKIACVREKPTGLILKTLSQFGFGFSNRV